MTTLDIMLDEASPDDAIKQVKRGVQINAAIEKAREQVRFHQFVARHHRRTIAELVREARESGIRVWK